jgi:hypothetical protein
LNAGDFLEANCRINGMWLIPSPCAHDELRSELELDFPAELEALANQFRWSNDELEDLKDGDRTAWEAFFEQMIGMGQQRWLIKVDTPVYETSRGSMSYSWGYYHNKIIVAESVTDGLQAALKWANDLFETAKATAAAERAKREKADA